MKSESLMYINVLNYLCVQYVLEVTTNRRRFNADQNNLVHVV
jgi:hypothetical protein